MSNKSFRQIGLTSRAGKPAVVQTLVQVLEKLQQLNFTPILDADTHKLINETQQNFEPSYQIMARNDLGKSCDLVIVVGGDGSILHAGRMLAEYDVPVLGINRGRLGFLADVSPEELYQKLQLVLQGDYQLDRRFLLKLDIKNAHGKSIYEAMALNDVVLHAGKSVHMIDFELSIDNQFVYRQHSDGLIFATPTGSTAYALSAGGPIMYPDMDAVALVPLNPHALSSRPLVVNGNSDMSIQIHADNRTQPMVSADGQSSVPIEENQTLHISKHPDKLTLLHPPGYDFFAACRTKLGWQSIGFD